MEVTIVAELRNVMGRILNAARRSTLSTFAYMCVGESHKKLRFAASRPHAERKRQRYPTTTASARLTVEAL
jgi:hypothetical protein